MKYTASEKVDIDKIKEEVSKKGFSDRAKKYIGSVLLAAQITGVSPGLADNLDRVQSDSQSNITEVQKDTITVESMKEEYKKLLENSTLSDNYKKVMLKNLEEGFESVEIMQDLAEKEFANGRYWYYEKKIELDDTAGLDTRIHEMMHAASTLRNIDGSDNVKSKGAYIFRRPEIDYLDYKTWINRDYREIGTGFTEGTTEYLADRVISENGIKPEYTSYSSLVSATKDIVAVYGEESVIDAYLGAPEKLEELMAKDGVSYTRFLELMDEQYRQEYREIEGWRSLYSENEPLGELIKDVRGKYRLKNPNNVLPESEWEKMAEEIADSEDLSYNSYNSELTEDLSMLYNENVVLEAQRGSAKELQELMKKDGLDWEQFHKKWKHYERFEKYSERYEGYEKIAEKRRELFLNIGKDIEDVRMKRLQENPNIDLPESQWIDYYTDWLDGSMDDIEQLRKEFVEEEYYDEGVLEGLVSLDENVSKEKDNEVLEQSNEQTSDTNLNIEEKPKNRLVAWFKNLKDKIVGRFKKSDEVLLLNSGDEKIESNDSKRNEFLESIKVDESELVYNQFTKDEERMQEEIRENSDNTEMER